MAERDEHMATVIWLSVQTVEPVTLRSLLLSLFIFPLFSDREKEFEETDVLTEYTVKSEITCIQGVLSVLNYSTVIPSISNVYPKIYSQVFESFCIINLCGTWAPYEHAKKYKFLRLVIVTRIIMYFLA